MMRQNVVRVFVAAIAVLMCAQVALAGGKDSRLAKGEVVVETFEVKGKDIPRVVVSAVVKAPMAKVWTLIEDCNKYTTTMTNLKSAKELSRKGNRIRCQTTADLPWPLSNLTAITEAVHTVKPGQIYSRAWTLISGDFEYNYGSWTLKPYADGAQTLLVYTVHVKPKMAVPDALISEAQQSALPDLMLHIRKQVE